MAAIAASTPTVTPTAAPDNSRSMRGFDVRDTEFWASSLAVISRHIANYEGLAGAAG